MIERIFQLTWNKYDDSNLLPSEKYGGCNYTHLCIVSTFYALNSFEVSQIDTCTFCFKLRFKTLDNDLRKYYRFEIA